MAVVRRTASDALVSMPSPPPLAQIVRLADDIGLHEHARYELPRPEHGYCVDDNARAIVVLGRDGRDAAAGMLPRCVRFVLAAQSPDGTFHNRYGPDRRWLDEPGTGDHWGRALWALGWLAARHEHADVRLAYDAFLRGARLRSPWPRAMAYAALGAVEVWRVAGREDREHLERLLVDVAAAIGAPEPDPAWRWPESRLTYANGRLPEALIAVGRVLGDDRLIRHGLDLLAWLVDTESNGEVMSFTPVGGRGPGDARPAFDQQPIEAWALADACARAWSVTGDVAWADAVERCAGWFLGRNDTGIPLLAPTTGGGCDGLHVDGRNENQGAESTLAMIATLQAARRVGVG
ncbi:MAG TPA: hypothetical protein VK891_08630 [Euzebyales bacterium]|nr:hypothetical protein [Euzebyales bacterium]